MGTAETRQRTAIDADIEAAVRRLLACAYAIVSDYCDSTRDENGMCGDRVKWFTLSVSDDGQTWNMVGRRRTRNELFAMVETICSR